MQGESNGLSALPAWRPLETVSAASLGYERFLRDYLHANRPVVVTDAVTAWPALWRWTPEDFKARFADEQVAVSYTETMRFDDFIDAVLASTEDRPGPYMYRLFLHEHLPALLADVIPQNVYSFPRRYASPLMRPQWRRPDGYLKLLVGGVGSKFPVLHYDGDNAHAAITEIYGDKAFVMFRPEDAPYLYVNPKVPNKSLIPALDGADPARFPLLAKATPYGAVLKPGHMVFVPCGWWHTAKPVTPSVSVCVNMLDGSNWRGFVDEVCRSVGDSRAKAWTYRAYLTALGALLSGCEAVQDRAPHLARALGWPARFAPTSAAAAPEPSATPLNILVPTP
jgi:histone arginine demethylase JMJD6